MSASDRPGVAVIGAGLMGHGIAQVFAVAGHPVTVFDQDRVTLAAVRGRIAGNLAELGLDPEALDRVSVASSLESAVESAAFVVDSVREDLEVKRRLFVDIEAAAPRDAVLASNTSVIPITRIMGALEHRERALGTHWWNPPFLVPLVEVVATEWTAPSVTDWTLELMRSAGKLPVHVRRDVPGFVGNRLQHALWREAIHLVESGVCDAETVDLVVKNSFGLRMAALGPLENADLVGTDLTLAVHATLFPDLDRSIAPSPYLEALVREGRLGMKSGSGFRDWTREETETVRLRLVEALKPAPAEAEDDQRGAA